MFTDTEKQRGEFRGKQILRQGTKVLFQDIGDIVRAEIVELMKFEIVFDDIMETLYPMRDATRKRNDGRESVRRTQTGSSPISNGITYGLRNMPTLSIDVRRRYFMAERMVIGTGWPVRCVIASRDTPNTDFFTSLISC